MIYIIHLLFKRLRVLFQNLEIHSDGAAAFASNCIFQVHPTARIIVKKGAFKVGYPLPGTIAYSSRPNTVIALAKGATLTVEGTSLIAGGTTVRIGEGGNLTLRGNNSIAHDCLLIARKSIEIGFGSAISWCVSLIDDDGHRFYMKSGNRARSVYHPLVIGSFTGIQMNTIVPRGVNIGSGTVICAGSVIRKNIPDNVVVYSKTELKVHSKLMGRATPNEST